MRRFPFSQRFSIGPFYSAFAALLLAVTNVGLPLAYEAGTNPSTMLMLRAASTVVVLTVLLKLTSRLVMLSPKMEFRMFFSGLLFTAAGFGLLNALAIAPVSSVVLVLYLFPLLSTLLDAIVRRAYPSLLALSMLLLALIGLYLALDVRELFVEPEGLLLALLAAVSVAATFVWNNRQLAQVDSEQITMRMFLVSLFVFGAYVFFRSDFHVPSTLNGQILFVGLLLIFAFAFLSMFRGAQMVGSVRASMIMNLEPICSIGLAVWLLNETVGTVQVIGAALVILAVIIFQFFERELS